MLKTSRAPVAALGAFTLGTVLMAIFPPSAIASMAIGLAAVLYGAAILVA